MDPTPDPIAHDFPPFFRVYKSGRIERLQVSEPVPPSTDPQTGVRSKDITISPETGVSARLFLPPIPDPTQKLPLLIYIHGGAFCIGSAFSTFYHYHVSTLASKANVVALSVEYRLAPEHPLPAAFEDSWDAAQWAFKHCRGDGPESWINNHVDFQRVFLAGDSAGANIAYTIADRAGSGNGPDGVKITGMILVHPFFMTNEPNKLMEFLFPSSRGVDDPMLNPRENPRLSGLGCPRVIVFVAEYDRLKNRGLAFYESVKNSGWNAEIDIVETKGENHVFHLFNPKCENALGLVKQVASFIY